MNHNTGFVLRATFLSVALLIIVASTWFSNKLAKELSAEEHKRMELWSEAIRLLAQDEDNGQLDYSLCLRIIESNQHIPVVLIDEHGGIQSHANLRLSKKTPERDLQKKTQHLLENGRCIEVKLSNNLVQRVYYDESRHLKQLRYFPFVQLGIMFLFLGVTLLSLSISKRAEQNRVWVGLSKETAHQLGTPISSLLAWEELLKLKEVDASILAEIEKDTRRLQTIAERFSKIGSKPEPVAENISSAIENAVNYMRGRTSKKVNIICDYPAGDVFCLLNIPLFEWVIENLCKNAIDAMDGNGEIRISVLTQSNHVLIDVKDNGKGIPKNCFKRVFHPGFTTKARGWGLGLSLVKRIVEEYHGGKIFVKSSEPGKGSTFRIILQKIDLE